MLKYLNKLPNDFVDQLNTGLMNKEFDSPVVSYIFDAFKGLEILPNIKILGYEWVPDEDKYDVNDHVIRRNSNKNKVIKNITETRCGVLYIDIEVSGLDKNGVMKVHYIKKPLIIPIQDEKGYYLIKGKKCYLIYQMVDKMLYPSFGAVTVKSLMPICVKTVKEEFHETLLEVDEKTDVVKPWTIPIYNIQIFKSAINVLLIYSHLGITKTLNFMEVDRFIKVVDKNSDYPKKDSIVYFDCGKKSDIVVAVKRDIFEKELYVRSITGCLVKLFEETKIKFADIDNWEEWMIIVGGKNTIRRGMYQHIFFNRLLDDVTRGELKINDYDKQNIYYLLRWVIQNYHILWAKDNLSMTNKRLRCNEYVGSFITAELSKRINRLVSLGDKATIKEYLNIFKFPEDIFVTKLYSSGVLRYSETNSDMDFGSHFKITKKGPNALGNNDARRIPIRQRSLHPSMLGWLDVASSSSSDPGQSGDLSPYCEMKSMYFDDSLYENEMHYKIAKYLDEYPLDDDHEEIVIKCDNEDQYNATLDALFKASEGKIKISGTSNNPMEIVVEKDPRDDYRKFDESFLMKNTKEDI
jgi:hypothetical protein